jgi:hypothetical protein
MCGTMMKMPKVWKLMKEFKNSCKCRGWQTSKSEDWVGINGSYHNFLWARDVHPSSFKKIVTNGKCVVCEGLSYRVVEASYTAWLFSEKPSETLVKTISENPTLSTKVALYDLSQLLAGKNSCVKLNQTESPVFREFESFLTNEMKVELKPLPSFSRPEADGDNFNIVQLA